MNLTHFVQWNEKRIRIYERITWNLGIALIALAAYLFLGGLMRIIIFGSSDSQPYTNAFGFVNRAEHLVNQVPTIFYLGLLLLAVGDFLAFVLGARPKPGLEFNFLPLVIFAGAGWAFVLAVYGIGSTAYSIHRNSLGTAPILPPVMNTFVWSTIPRVSLAAVQTAIAVAVVRLTQLIVEERATV